jgi:hypothetical protein
VRRALFSRHFGWFLDLSSNLKSFSQSAARFFGSENSNENGGALQI